MSTAELRLDAYTMLEQLKNSHPNLDVRKPGKTSKRCQHVLSWLICGMDRVSDKVEKRHTPKVQQSKASPASGKPAWNPPEGILTGRTNSLLELASESGGGALGRSPAKVLSPSSACGPGVVSTKVAAPSIIERARRAVSHCATFSAQTARARTGHLNQKAVQISSR